MFCSLQGVIDYFRRLYVPRIQWLIANLIVDISPSILSGSIPTHLFPLYKALRGTIFHFSSKIFKSFRESQRTVSQTTLTYKSSQIFLVRALLKISKTPKDYNTCSRNSLSFQTFLFLLGLSVCLDGQVQAPSRLTGRYGGFQG